MSDSQSGKNAMRDMSHEEIMSALFAHMVIQNTNMALMLLGQVPHPESGERLHDVEAARMFIDQLEMLEVKTKGNLTREEEKLLKEITDRYNEQLSPYYAASRLWVDGIIDPADTRKIISQSIEAANHAPVEKFNVGVIQT